MRKAELARKFDEILDFSGVEAFVDTPVKHYPSGMYVRLAFAVAAHLEPGILLVDEVLSVGDVAFQRKCLTKMGDVAQEGRTIWFVSHNMSSIRKLCGKCIELRGGRIGACGETGARKSPSSSPPTARWVQCSSVSSAEYEADIARQAMQTFWFTPDWVTS